jgi:hypothetical protein
MLCQAELSTELKMHLTLHSLEWFLVGEMRLLLGNQCCYAKFNFA